MIVRGFKSVMWVAAVGGAAIGCYMISLRVATERADLARVERQIVAAKQQIRSLQTELGTRGRLSQLERWNADVLALAAPASGQFLEDEFTLARLDLRDQTVAERAEVRMASLETEQAPAAPKTPAEAPAVKVARAVETEAPAPRQVQPAIVHRAAFAPAETRAAPATPPARRLAAAAQTPARRLDPKLAEEIGAAARAEKGPEKDRTRPDTARGKGEAGAAGTR
jgi:hypothetical protein